METIPPGSGAEAAAFVAVSDGLHVPSSRTRETNNVIVARGNRDPRQAILIYSPQFNTIGGVETHLVRLSCFLARKNCQVTLVTTGGMLESTRVAELSAAGVEFIAPSCAGNLSLWRKATWLAWLTTTRLRRQHWDVVYSNAQGSLSWILRLLKRSGTRLVHHYHTAGDERDQRTWGWLFPKWLRTVDEIVACSTTTAQNLRRVLGTDCTTDRDGRDKVRVIRYLSADITVPTARICVKTDAKLRFGFVGRLMRGKGIDIICRLSQDPELAEIEWHIHGCGEHYDAAYFKPFSNVQYHGRYHGTTGLTAILERLDAVVLFSTYQEGQPISLIEAMAAGLPWIATDQGGTRELMWSPSNCRLIDSGCDYSDAKRAVLELADAIRQGQTSCNAQRRAYEDNLAPATIGERWMEFLAEDVTPALRGAWFPGTIR